jgi:nucleotide-binding universal stress UspA family protein
MFGRIVVGVAKAERGERAVEVAMDLAERYGAELHLVMAFDRGAKDVDSPARKAAEGFLQALRREAPVEAHVHAMPGDPADTVLLVAAEVGADLIVVGNRGMGGAGRILGSVPNSVAHKAPCSVLIADTSDAAG